MDLRPKRKKKEPDFACFKLASVIQNSYDLSNCTNIAKTF